MRLAPSPNGNSTAKMEFRDTSTQKLADSLGVYLDRPVLDRTGLKAEIRFPVEYEVDRSVPGGNSGGDLRNPLAARG